MRYGIMFYYNKNIVNYGTMFYYNKNVVVHPNPSYSAS